MGITVRPYEAEDLEDWLEFFDHRAFHDNPSWQSCYCTYFHRPQLAAVTGGKKLGNRAYAIELLGRSLLRGYLARDEAGRILGWCNAGDKGSYVRRFAEAPAERERRIFAILCFIVEKEWRGKGIARLLLEGALADAKARGFELAEAYPKSRARSAAGHFHGPRSLYEALGFKETEIGGLRVMRKELS